MAKRIFTRIWLSVLVLASGLFLWSNVDATGSSTVATLDQNMENLDTICVPGVPDYPECMLKKAGIGK